MATTNEKKKVSSNSNYIPDDIVFSVLSKLPIKSLKRFSCVRKSWSLLFENPNFITMFRNNLLSKPHLLNDDDDVCLILYQILGPCEWDFYLLSGDKFKNKVKLDLPPPFRIQQSNVSDLIRILGSAINGTLCVYDCENQRNVILWNPATEEVKVIPLIVNQLPPKVITKFTLHGFGYDHVTDDYKIIQHADYITFSTKPGDYVREVKHDPFWKIYSLKRNSWRKIDFDMPTRYQFPDTEVYYNGVCHWWGETNNKTYLVSFNLSNETYCTTPSPLEDVQDSFDVNLAMLNGSLAMISNYRNSTSFQISILGELGVEKSWIRLFNVGPFSGIENPIGVGKKGIIFFTKINFELVCLDLTTGVIEEIGVKEGSFFSQMVIYKKTHHPIEEIKM